MHTDVLLDPFGADWARFRDAAAAAVQSGFDGVWTWDHLGGMVHRRSHVLESWTVLAALAATVPDTVIGPLVLNVANRPAGTLAVAAATLQQVCGGRLILGLGAGGGWDTPYPAEQRALGREVAGDIRRRRDVRDTIRELKRVWSEPGFLQPVPPIPIVIGGFGPKMAALAGRHADGLNAPGGAGLASLLQVARAQRATPFLATASAGLSERWIRPGPDRERLEQIGVDRLILVTPPDVRQIEAAGRHLTSASG